MEKGDGYGERPGGAGAHCGALKEPGRVLRHGIQQAGEQRYRMLRECDEARAETEGVLLSRFWRSRRGGYKHFSGALSLTVCPGAGSPPFIPACLGACCSDVGSVCAFQNSQTSQECWLARAAAKHLPWLHCTSPPPPSQIYQRKKKVRFFHFK